MYLRYQLDSQRFNEIFTIDYPVANAEESKSYMKKLLENQGKGKKYSGFALLDMSKKVIERYPLHRKKNHIKQIFGSKNKL